MQQNMSQTPEQGNSKASNKKRQPSALNPKEKAAIIVRLLLAEGEGLPISEMPEHMQAALTEQMSKMHLVDRSTLASVVDEFMHELNSVGLTFPGSLDGALTIMNEHITQSTVMRLRRLSGDPSKADPWDRLVKAPSEQIMSIIDAESNEIAAVMMSKLPVSKAAELLSNIPKERAQQIAYTVLKTGDIAPETVRRIGISLATQMESTPIKAFDVNPVERIGGILNIVNDDTRDEVLQAIEYEDSEYAEQVRKMIFTFAHIPTRIFPQDTTKIVRQVEQSTVITALAGAKEDEKNEPVIDFFLSNIPQRLAQSLKEEIEARGKVKTREAEAAMSQIVIAIRELETTNEIALIPQDEVEE